MSKKTPDLHADISDTNKTELVPQRTSSTLGPSNIDESDTSHASDVVSQKIAPHEKTLCRPPKNIATHNNSSNQGNKFKYLASGSNTTGMRHAKYLAEQAQLNKGTLLKGRFVLEEVLGQGGMGLVFRAKDLRKVEAEDSNPYVAAKVLNDDFKNHPHAFVALQQETAKSHELAHPNIVTVHDFDRDGSTVYMTMELLEGLPLDKVLKNHRDKGLDKDLAIGLFKNLCSALAYAHDKQIIHSDFKPGNIYITKDNIAKVFDFGIARAVSGKNSSSQFDAGSLGALTPAYASLEMIQNDLPHASDDIYALGCVFYEMLTGKHPYGRLPADKALTQKIKPARIKSLSNKQWKALEKAIALKRKNRTQSIHELEKAFNLNRRTIVIRTVSAALALTLVGLGWVLLQQYQNTNTFKEKIVKKLQHAQHCFDQENYDCAKEQSLIVLNLEPGNSQAKKIKVESEKAYVSFKKKQLFETLLSQAQKCFDQKNYDCAQVKAIELKELDPEKSQAIKILNEVDIIKKQAAIAEHLQQTDDCLAKKDLNCAQLFFKKAKEIDPESLAVLETQQKIQLIILKEQNDKIEFNIKINAHLEHIRTCELKDNYKCMIKVTNEILEIAPQNTEAIKKQQQAKLALKRISQNNSAIKRMLKRAQQCLDKGNYSCAIARSESALDISPQHPLALGMKEKAEEAQRLIKSSININ